jgi:Sulfotransferase domain
MRMTGKSFMPTFIIGGAPRSGTTFLAEALSRHPDVYMAQPLIPEPKVFLGYRQEPETYVERYRKLFAPANGHRLRGEKTANYLENPDLCGLMKSVLPPDIRWVFIVREPIARAYSNFLWSTKNGLEKLTSFEEAIALEGTRESPLPPERFHAKPYDYLIRSNYDVLAARYLEAFGKDQVRFLLYEDITNRPRKLVSELQDFIGAQPLDFEKLDVGVVNSAREVGPTINPRTEAELRERMRPAVDRFAGLTGLDISSWGY